MTAAPTITGKAYAPKIPCPKAPRDWRNEKLLPALTNPIAD